MRLIDADELMMHRFQPPEFSVCPVDICHDNVAVDAYKRGWNDAIEAIVQNEPTVEPKKGKWEIDVDCEYDVFDIAGERTWAIKAKCSECDFAMRFIEGHGMFNYCPNCGARMEESE